MHPWPINNSCHSVLYWTICPFKGRWEVWRKTKAEWKSGPASWKFNCVPSLSWNWSERQLRYSPPRLENLSGLGSIFFYPNEIFFQSEIFSSYMWRDWFQNGLWKQYKSKLESSWIRCIILKRETNKPINIENKIVINAQKQKTLVCVCMYKPILFLDFSIFEVKL